MKYTREALALASLAIGALVNGLLFSIGWWKTDGIIDKIILWVVFTGLFTYCIYKALTAIAKGGIEND
jgi:hypothetical protein